MAALASPSVAAPHTAYRLKLGAACGAAVVLGLAAEWVAFGWRTPLEWLPDLVVGWTYLGAALAVYLRNGSGRICALLCAAGLTWFAANLATVAWEPAAWLAAQAAFVHRGLIVQAIVSSPTGRLRTAPQRVVVALGYAVSAAPVAGSDVVVLACSRALAAAALATLPRRSATDVLLVAGVLVAGAAVRLTLPGGEGDQVVLLVYEAALAVVAFDVAAGASDPAQTQAAVGDLVVELGEGPSGTLRDGLAQALGDPTLAIGHWLPEAGRFVDAAGRDIDLPAAGSERAVTTVERAGEPVAVLVHDPGVLDDVVLADAVANAAHLGAANARLQAEVQDQLRELHASRRRLLDSRDEEHRALEGRLRDGVEAQLSALSGTLDQARAECGDLTDVVGHLADARDQLGRSLEELHELGRGLHPRVLSESGLGGALRQLRDLSPVEVDVDVPERRFAEAIESAVYFICAEALTNAARYAPGSSVRIEIRDSGAVISVLVRDNGPGGAKPRRGGGLRGLADRVESLGGTLRVDGHEGNGTLVVAEIPTSSRTEP